jgi:hypothetical protein
MEEVNKRGCWSLNLASDSLVLMEVPLKIKGAFSRIFCVLWSV